MTSYRLLMTTYRLLKTPYRLLMTPYRLLMTVRLDVPPTVSADILATAMVRVIYINGFTTKKLKITTATVHRIFCSLETFNLLESNKIHFLYLALLS
ncbi:Hypothetical predicted protein [Octopus vulgaris]|uniref:Uncharacterized protein n=1 Tax=Octopus vulgaris TaxID=6645 RepID=A0AA36FMQ3_OCTVU|nr:Hypothetical predicted protein [Octopus vulgaris]